MTRVADASSADAVLAFVTTAAGPVRQVAIDAVWSALRFRPPT